MTESKDLTKRFAANLRSFRKAMGLTQAIVAERMGKHQSYVADMEKGRYSPTLDSVVEFASALGITDEQLLYGAPSEILEISDSVA